MSQDPTTNRAGLARLFADTNGPVGKIIERKTIAVENAAKASLLRGGSGRLYKRRRSGRAGASGGPGAYIYHQASAPGEPPASDTGQLLNSTGHTIGVRDGVVTGRVGSGERKAMWLELGTRHMAPRPWLRPALVEGLAE